MAIGPIGDDIPSIFPIVLGVVLFIGVVGYANSQVDAKNSYLEIRKSVLSLSYVIVSSGALTDADFAARCPQFSDYATRQNVKAFFSLKKHCKNVDLSKDILADTDPSPASDTLFCPSIRPKVGTADISATNLPKDFQILSFPVAVDCDATGKVKGLGMFNIIAWRSR